MSSHAVDFEKLFIDLPERYVVLCADPQTYTMVAASDAYLAVTAKTRAEVIGKRVFDVFPDVSPLAKKTGKGDLARSLENCIRSKAPDSTGVIRYDIPTEKGAYSVRYWQATHYPLLDDEGEVAYIVQNTQDITEMVETSEQLRLAELQFDDALSSGLVGSWTWNIGDNKVRADKGLARIFGISPQEALHGLSIDDFTKSIYADDREQVIAQIDNALTHKTSYECEYRTYDAKQQIHWVIARGKVECNDEGEPVAFPGVIIDITDRKNAEQAQKESEMNLRFMADSMPQLVWITRPDGYHEYYNKQWYEYTGTRTGETDGEGWNELFHPDDRKRAHTQWQQSLKTGSPYEIEYRLLHAASGQYRWVIGRALPHKDAQGTIVKWYGTCTDIHDQKHSEQVQKFLSLASKELASSLAFKQTLRSIIELCVPTLADWCAIDLYDEDTGVSRVGVAHVSSKETKKAMAYRARHASADGEGVGVLEVIRTGKSLFYPTLSDEQLEKMVDDEEDREYIQSLHISSAIVVPLMLDGVVSGAITIHYSDSNRRYTHNDLVIVEELASRVSLYMSNTKLYEDSLQDLKKRRQLEEELRIEKSRLELSVRERTSQLRLTNEGLRDEINKRQRAEKDLHTYTKELARSNQELQDFAYVSSHDLQEPLRKIRAFGDLLETEYADKLGDGADYLARMQGAAGRMSTLIEDLLVFSRVTTKPPAFTQVNLNTVLSDVVSDLDARIADTQGEVVIEKLPVVSADTTHMRQLFQNLVANALKFHRPDAQPRVVVSAHEEEDWYNIQVSDNGIGFDMKYVERIFAVFQRLHGKDSYEGTGIGLAVCRKIVDRYGGTIVVESVKNKGTTFVVRLPKKLEE